MEHLVEDQLRVVQNQGLIPWGAFGAPLKSFPLVVAARRRYPRSTPRALPQDGEEALPPPGLKPRRLPRRPFREMDYDETRDVSVGTAFLVPLPKSAVLRLSTSEEQGPVIL